MKELSFKASRLLCGNIRDFLNECKFKGVNIEFFESSGFFQRRFIIRGENSDIENILFTLKKWSDENNLGG